MERIFRVACGPAEGGQDRPVRVNDMLEPEFVSCSAEEQTLELRFPLNEWMLNPMGTMHGGIIATTVQTVIVLAVFVYISVVHNRASKIFW